MTPEAVRRIAAGLPGVSDDSSDERLGFAFAGKGIAWTFMQRDTPKQKRWPNIHILAVRCPLEHKELLRGACAYAASRPKRRTRG